MSDLQCAATFLVPGGDPEDLEDAGLVSALASERVVGVYAAPDREVEAARLAASLEVGWTSDDDLGDLSYTKAVEALADLHRGETVLLLPGHAAQRQLGVGEGPGGGVRLAVDSDGWAVTGWPEQPTA